MVNGNYVVQDTKLVEAGTQARCAGADRRAARSRRGFRTAAELNLTLPPRRALHPSDLDGEPNLLRYVVSEESDGDSSPRRQSFTRKPRNFTDLGEHKGNGNGAGSPNLPTIAEHAAADSFEMRSGRGRRFSLDGGGGLDRLRSAGVLFPDYTNVPAPKFDNTKYFSKPSDGLKFAAKGTHPDSLYRIPLGSGGERARSVPARCYRLLRWPAALLAVCVALALFIYYVMPDSAESELLESNATYWEAGLAGAAFRHRPAQPASSAPPPGLATSRAPDPGASDPKTTEIDFEGTAVEMKTDPDDARDTTKQIMFHPAPLYPEHVTPDVQYGNEKGYLGERLPKILQDLPTSREESTLHPYHQTKGDFAVYVKDEDAHSWAGRENLTELDNPHSNFTSGHSKLFGLSVEEAAKQATTRSSAGGARVSPTLPPRPRGPGDTTTGTSVTEEASSCRSTSLEVCRHVLRYDLAAPPLLPPLAQDDFEDLLSDVQRLAAFGCNPRVVNFVCHLLEPECTSSASSVKKPCNIFCEDSIRGCERHVFPNSTLESLLDCSRYPGYNCVPAREPCLAGEMACQEDVCISSTRKCDGRADCGNSADETDCPRCNKTEYKCPRSEECIPRRWLCDGYADCPSGEDELQCQAGPDGFAPLDAPANDQKWLQKFASSVGLDQGVRIGEESRLSPRVQLPGNALPRPTKVDRNRVMETSKMHDVAVKGDGDSKELLMMSDSSAAARPYQRPPTRRPAAPRTTTTEAPAAGGAGDAVSELLDDLEVMVDSEKWWEGEGRGGEGGVRAGTAHASPCPAGELRCVDGRCIMFSQLCDGHVDCSDSADEDNCNT